MMGARSVNAPNLNLKIDLLLEVVPSGNIISG